MQSLQPSRASGNAPLLTKASALRVPAWIQQQSQPVATQHPPLACYGEDVISKITRYSCLIIPLYRSHFRRQARVMRCISELLSGCQERRKRKSRSYDCYWSVLFWFLDVWISVIKCMNCKRTEIFMLTILVSHF